MIEGFGKTGIQSIGIDRSRSHHSTHHYTPQHAPDSGIRIEASPSHLARGGLWVTVAWSGVSDPTEGDFVAAYAPLEADPQSTAPIKYQYAAAADAEHLRTGAGRVKFRLLEYVGGSYWFGFFRGNATRPMLAAKSGAVSVGGGGDDGEGGTPAPQGIHLALTDKGDEMRVTWKTAESFFFIPDAETPGSDEAAADAVAVGVDGQGGGGPEGGDGRAAAAAAVVDAAAGGKTRRRAAAAAAAGVATQEVQYAKASAVEAAKKGGGSLEAVAWSSTAARAASFARGDLCGEPAATVGWSDPGSTHSAVMRGLTPGTAYAYRVGNAGTWLLRTLRAACVCVCFSKCIMPAPHRTSTTHIRRAWRLVGRPDLQHAAAARSGAGDDARERAPDARGGDGGHELGGERRELAGRVFRQRHGQPGHGAGCDAVGGGGGGGRGAVHR